MPRIQNFILQARTLTQTLTQTLKNTYSSSSDTPFEKGVLLASLANPQQKHDGIERIFVYRGVSGYGLLRKFRATGMSQPRSDPRRRYTFNAIKQHVEGGNGTEFVSTSTDRNVANMFASQRQAYMQFGKFERCTGITAMLLLEEGKTANTVAMYEEHNRTHPFKSEKEIVVNRVEPHEVIALNAIDEKGNPVDPEKYDITCEENDWEETADLHFKPRDK